MGRERGGFAALDVLDSGESAGSGWEHQRKAGMKAPSSFDPGEFTFELKNNPEGNQVWLVLRLPELRR